MSNLTINVDVKAGTSINQAAKEAIELSKKLSTSVEFNFNGVTCIVNPGGSINKLVAGYRGQLCSNSDHKIAVS